MNQMLMRKLIVPIVGLVLALGLALPVAGPPAAAPVAASPGVEIQLGLLLDASTSINATNFGIMLNGTAAAIESTSVPKDGTVELTVVIFHGGSGDDAVLKVGPVVLTTANAEPAGSSTVGDAIRAITRPGGTLYTPLACGIYRIANAMADSGNFSAAHTQVINIVTDGEPNRCCTNSSYEDTNCTSSQARTSAVNARNYAISHLAMTDGSGHDRITAEGIGITTSNTEWLRTSIVWPQPGVLVTNGYPDEYGWVVLVDSWDDFEPAIEEKLRVIVYNPCINVVPDGDHGERPIS